jgi:hypothetical protein
MSLQNQYSNNHRRNDFLLHDQDNFEHKLVYYPDEMNRHYQNDWVTKIDSFSK